MSISLLLGDCREVLPTLPDASVDSVVTDPPYELGFMGKAWDASGIAYDVSVWRECLRVLKPGGHLLAFGGSRTYHRLACAVEDAGFEIRDQIMWVYGSGFPKNLDVSKAIDREAGAVREVLGRSNRCIGPSQIQGKAFAGGKSLETQGLLTAPATDAARQWQGWGTALKPSHEPIVVARKPLIGTVAENVLAFGCGAINVDGCRVDLAQNEDAEKLNARSGGKRGFSSKYVGGGNDGDLPPGCDLSKGRWPANLIHDGSAEVVERFPVSTQSNARAQSMAVWDTSGGTYKGGIGKIQGAKPYADTGSAARFFYTAKADAEDRDQGCEGFALGTKRILNGGIPSAVNSDPRGMSGGGDRLARNHHPTVKPTDLMRYLVRLVTRRGGTVLDPFLGSGSTGKAAALEQCDFIGIELNAEYLDIARARIAYIAPEQVERVDPPTATPRSGQQLTLTW